MPVHLVCIFGPPAVGPMTVGHELARLTGFKLLHNHMTIEPVLDIFPFDSPSFGRLVGEFRRRIIEEAVGAKLPGLIFTFVWDLEHPDDRDLVAAYTDIVERGGGQVSFVELAAPLEERLVRNVTEFRLDRKRSKRDLDFSRQNLFDAEAQWRMNTGHDPTVGEKLLEGRAHLRVDNTDLPAAVVAKLVAEAWGLARG